jgi:hypothetical protein
MSTIDTKSPIVHQDELRKKKVSQSLNHIAEPVSNLECITKMDSEPRGRRNAAAYQVQYRKTFVAQQQSTGQKPAHNMQKIASNSIQICGK